MDDFAALPADPEVRRFSGLAQPSGREQASERVRADETEWEEHGHWMLAIEERTGGRFLGRVTLHDWARPDNARSIAVAARLGMAELRTEVLSGRPVVVYTVGRRA